MDLIHALKRRLREQGITYAEVAKSLNMSEANIKRMFSEKRFYLAVFDDICQLLGIEISDLARQIEHDRQRLQSLSEAQEQELASDTRWLLIAFLVINGITFQEIASHYQFSEAQLVAYLTQLDRLSLIELLPNNRVKLLIAPNFAWRQNGPIQAFFKRYLLQNFLNDEFNNQGEIIHFMSGVMTPASRDTLLVKLKQLAKEFNQSNSQDSNVTFDDRQVPSMIVAMRCWRPEIFKQFKR